MKETISKNGKESIKEALYRFLNERKKSISNRIYRQDEGAIMLFEGYLNGYAGCGLNEGEAEQYERALLSGNKTFCELFGAEKISGYEIQEFLTYFMPQKVICGKEMVRSAGRTMKMFSNWLLENGYDLGTENFSEILHESRKEVMMAEEIADLIVDFALGNIQKRYAGNILVGRFEIQDIDNLECRGDDDKLYRIVMPKQIKNKLQEGWTLYLEIVKTVKGWEIVGGGSVYT